MPVRFSRALVVGGAVSIVFFVIYSFVRSPFSFNTIPEAEFVVGQNFIVGIAGPKLNAANIELLEKVKPGGIVLYRYNVGSDEATKQLVDDLQKIAIRTTGMEYLIFIDEEPNGATRLDIYRNIFIKDGVDWERMRKETARLREIGIDVNLAPIADYSFKTGSATGFRAPFTEIAHMTSFNDNFIKMLRDHGIAATLKHFPGAGLLSEDTHTALVRSKATIAEIQKSVEIFKSGIDAGADFVMTNHGIYDSIDPNMSASLSPRTVKLLRDSGFKGMIITDDIANMPLGSPGQIGVSDAALRTLMAGHTMVLLGSKRSATADAYEYMLDAYRKDASVKKRADSNYRKVTKYKADRARQTMP